METLGCTTVICTDKTGTLTENEMTACNLWLGGRRLGVTGAGYAPDGSIVEGGHLIKAPVFGDLRGLLVASLQCNNARLLPPNGDSSRWGILGDPTEAALLVAALKGGLHVEAEREQNPRLRELPFESRRRRMSTIHQVQGSPVVYAKGAPKEVLELCTHIRLNEHRTAPLMTISERRSWQPMTSLPARVCGFWPLPCASCRSRLPRHDQ